MLVVIDVAGVEQIESTGGGRGYSPVSLPALLPF